MNYSPAFDTQINTRTVIERLTTVHTDYIDWNYPFDDQNHTRGLCCSDDGKREHVEKLKGYLKTCEELKPGTFASNYGGLPRIWHRVIKVGMVSQWPYWTPRPCVLVRSTLGTEWYDWYSLTGAEVQQAGGQE